MVDVSCAPWVEGPILALDATFRGRRITQLVPCETWMKTFQLGQSHGIA